MFFFMMVYLVLVIIRPQDYPAVVDSPGLPWQPLALILAALFWLFSARKSFAAPQYLLLPVFLLVAMISKIVNGWTGGAIFVFALFAPVILAFVLLSNAADTRSRLRTTMAVFAVCGAVLAVHGIQQSTTGIGWTGMEMSQETRIQYVGIFNDPNDLGMLFVMCLPMALYLSRGGGLMGLRRLFWWGAGAALVYGIYLTNSRGAMLALVCVAAVWVWRRRGPVTASLLGAGMIGVLMMLPSRLSELDAGESSAAGRVDAWYSGLEMFLYNPLFGIGPGLFADNNANLTAHNSFVLVMAEMGLVGYTIW